MNVKKIGTQGTFTVEVTGQHTLSFEGDSKEMQLYPDRRRNWNLEATHRLPGGEYQGISIILPPDLPLDGKNHIYQFSEGAARLYFSLFENQGVASYAATSGEIEVCFDGNHLDAKFSGTAEFGSKQITLTYGMADLTGLSKGLTAQYPATGNLNGTFQGGPHPGPRFEATELRIDSSNFEGHRPDRWIFIGEHNDEGLPAVRNIISIVIGKTVTGLNHDLAGNDQVWIQYQRVPGMAFNADAGELRLNQAVGDDQASGTFYCTFNKDKSDEFKVVDGVFNLVKVSH